MRRIVCWLTVTAMLAAAATSAFGASADAGMEAAIRAAKRVLDIPETCSEFSGDSQVVSLGDGVTLSVWNLFWYSEDGNESMRAQVNTDGTVLSMDYRKTEEATGLGKVTRAEGKKTAEDFLRRVIGTEAGNLREISGDVNAASSDWEMRYQFRYYHQEIPVLRGDVEVTVNRYSGKVASYSNWQWVTAGDTYADGSQVLSQEKGAEAFFQAYPLQLVYRSCYDYEKKELSVFPVYEDRIERGAAVDGKTGKPVMRYSGVYSEFGDAKNESAADSAGGANSDGGLTKQEQEELEAVAGLINSQKAESLLRSAFPELGTSQCLGQSLSSVKFGPMTGSYIWSLDFESATGSVNASDGRILSFYTWEDRDSSDQRNIGEKRATEIAQRRLESVASPEIQDDILVVPGTNQEGANSYYFSWNRQVSGTSFVDNGVNITVDGATGRVRSYRLTWYDNAEFPSLAQVLPLEKAQEKFLEETGFGLFYMQTAKGGTYQPAYKLEDGMENLMLNAFSGTVVGYDGKPFIRSSRPSYSDLEGHWSKTAVIGLLENGYYLEGSQFKPDAVITQGEFLTYLYGNLNSGRDPMWICTRAVDRGLIAEEEKAFAEPLTRGMAAKIAVRYLGLEKAAEHPEIFTVIFTDQVSPQYKGYAAICKGLGIMNGDKKGRFNEGTQMTRGQAASVLYQLLSL